MALINIIQDAADEIGLPRPNSALSSTDTQVRQLVRFAQREGRALSRRHLWTSLIKEATWTSVAAESQGTLATIAPDGYDFIINDTIWNRSQQERVGGPLNPADWQLLKSATVTGPYYDYRIQAVTDVSKRDTSSLLLIPTPPAGDTFAFEYQSKNWCESSGGTGQSKWEADSDVGRLDEDLTTLGVIWRFLRAKGMDYSEEFNTYELEVNDAMARDGGRRILKLDESDGDYEPTMRAPVGSWNL